MGCTGRRCSELSAGGGAFLATFRSVMGLAQDRGAGGSRGALLVGAIRLAIPSATRCRAGPAGRRAVVVAAGGVPALADIP
jgi:hypothetical protein